MCTAQSPYVQQGVGSGEELATVSLSSFRGLVAELAIPITFFLLFLGVGALQPFIVPYVREKNPEISLARAQMIIAAIYLLFAPCRLAAGLLMRRLGAKRMLIFGAVGYLGFAIILCFGRSYLAFLISAAVLALGAGFIWTAGSTRVLDTSASRRYGAASGVLYFFTKAGIALGALLLGSLVPRDGNYTTFFATSITLGLAAVFSAFFTPPARASRVSQCSPRSFAPLSDLRVAGQFLLHDGNWLVPLVMCISFAAYGILLTLVNSFVSGVFGPQHVGWVSGCFYAVGVFSSYVGGWASDWAGRWRVLIGSFVCGGMAMLLLALGRSALSVAAGGMLFGIQFGAIPAVVNAWVGDLSTPAERPIIHASTFAWRDLGAGGAAVAVALLGMGGLDARGSFLVFAGVFLATAVVVGWMMSRGGTLPGKRPMG